MFTFVALTVATLLSWTFLPLADGSLLLVYMISFTCSEVGMALMVASVFSKVGARRFDGKRTSCAEVARGHAPVQVLLVLCISPMFALGWCRMLGACASAFFRR